VVAEGVVDPATARQLLPPELLAWGEGVRVQKVTVIHKPPTCIRTPREEWLLPPRHWVERTFPADRAMVMVTVVRDRERDGGEPRDIQVGDDGEPPKLEAWRERGQAGLVPVMVEVDTHQRTLTGTEWGPPWRDCAWPWRPWLSVPRGR
jgi:hypothetical protein